MDTLKTAGWILFIIVLLIIIAWWYLVVWIAVTWVVEEWLHAYGTPAWALKLLLWMVVIGLTIKLSWSKE